jgi:hypothetical protein
MKLRGLWTAVVMCSALLLFATQPALAQQSGDLVVFLIPADANQPEPPSGPNDQLVYTGGRVTSIDTTGCAAGNHPVQNAVLVDPDGGRSGRIIGLVTISQTDPVPPGTRLKNLTEETPSCTIGGTIYRRYRGTVE